MVLGRRSLPICRVSRAPSETPDCPNVWTPTWKGLGGDPFVGGWFMNHPVFLPMTDPCILVYLPTFGFNSHHCNKGKKVGEVTHVFLQTQGKKYIYIYIHTAYIYIYIYYTQVCRAPTVATVTKEEMSKSWRCDIRNEKSNKNQYLTPGDPRGPRMSHHENNYIQTL